MMEIHVGRTVLLSDQESMQDYPNFIFKCELDHSAINQHFTLQPARKLLTRTAWLAIVYLTYWKLSSAEGVLKCSKPIHIWLK